MVGNAAAVRRQGPVELWGEAFDPGERLLVWEWADANRVLSGKESAEQGRWRTDRVPYLRFPMEVLSVSHPAEHVILQWGAQLGKTQTVLNFVGYCIDHEPGPMLGVLPTLDTAKRYSRNRIDSLVENTPSLRGKVAQQRSRDASNSRLLKDFPGGFLSMAGANSPALLREASIRYLLREEIDAWLTNEEGDPLGQSARRTATYRGRRKILDVSTPKHAGTSKIDRARRRAEQEWHWHVPCPVCGFAQQLERKQLRYVVPDRDAVDDETELVEIPGVTYECVRCKALLPESRKPAMMAAGAWVCIRNRGMRSVAFFLSALNSTLGLSWGEIAAMQETAKGDPEATQVLVNTVDALPYQEQRERPNVQLLLDRRSTYAPGVVQPGVRFLTMAVDVQAAPARLEIELKGWGRNLRNWSLLYRELLGDPQGPAVWAELDELLATEWPTAARDGTLPVWCCAIDSGKFPECVYRWARAHPAPLYGARSIAVRSPNTVMVVKGRGVWDRTLLTAEKVSREEKRRGLKVIGVGVSGLKRELYRWLRLERGEHGDEPRGFPHWPASYDERYFRGLTAEELKIKWVRGQPVEWWDLPSGTRNEPLDLHVYNRAAAAACGIDVFTSRDWERLEEKLPPSLLTEAPVGLPSPPEGDPPAGGSPPASAPKPPADRPAPIRVQRRISSAWLRR